MHIIALYSLKCVFFLEELNLTRGRESWYMDTHVVTYTTKIAKVVAIKKEAIDWNLLNLLTMFTYCLKLFHFPHPLSYGDSNYLGLDLVIFMTYWMSNIFSFTYFHYFCYI